MTTSLIKQKLHDYIDSTSEENLEALYHEVIEGADEIVWDDHFTAEMESREQEYLKGNVKTISLSETLEIVKNTIHKVQANAVQH